MEEKEEEEKEKEEEGGEGGNEMLIVRYLFVAVIGSFSVRVKKIKSLNSFPLESHALTVQRTLSRTIRYYISLHTIRHCSTAQHSTAQHSTVQYSTAQHSTAQHSTAQHSTAQYSTAQHSTLTTLHHLLPS